jgi:hypothetical protein
MKVRLAALLFGVSLALVPACSRKESLDPSKMPPEVRGDYAIFAQRCSKCHTLARPLNANITDDHQWVDYVNRMRRQPASGITVEDQEHILRFLRYYAADLRRAEAERHGPPASPPAADGGAP